MRGGTVKALLARIAAPFLVQPALVVPLPRSHVQIGASYPNLDAVKILIFFGILRTEGQRVLVARLLRDLRVKIFEAAIFSGVKSIASGSGCILFQPRAFLLQKGVAHR